jgi:hypothetical protein
MDLKETEYEVAGSVYLPQNWVRWKILGTMVNNLRFIKGEEVLDKLTSY